MLVCWAQKSRVKFDENGINKIAELATEINQNVENIEQEDFTQ